MTSRLSRISAIPAAFAALAAAFLLVSPVSQGSAPHPAERAVLASGPGSCCIGGNVTVS